ncbi:MAG: response regulator [SAR202 cluster bacterium]|nr:response regulator [SAR202 cluster bacterium]
MECGSDTPSPRQEASATVSKVLRVKVVEDDPLARAGLAALLAQRPDIEVVGQAAGHPELATDAQVYRPDALVWDTGWEPAVVLERLADLRSELPPVVVLVAAGAQAAEARAAGAHGVLLREVTAPRLATALRAVAEGLWVWPDDRLPCGFGCADGRIPVR